MDRAGGQKEKQKNNHFNTKLDDFDSGESSSQSESHAKLPIPADVSLLGFAAASDYLAASDMATYGCVCHKRKRKTGP